jgi:hypothetical protein
VDPVVGFEPMTSRLNGSFFFRGDYLSKQQLKEKKGMQLSKSHLVHYQAENGTIWDKIAC